MSSEVSAAGADQDLRRANERLERELAEAREQQATTAEILRVISGAPMDSQRVFAEIAASAARLCDASDAGIHQVDGEVLRLVASHGSIPKGDDTLPLTREVSPDAPSSIGKRFRSPMYRPKLVSTQLAAPMPDALGTAPCSPSH
jgi:hypothetical protein